MRSDTKIIFEMFDTDSKKSSVPSCEQCRTDILTLKNEKADTNLYATTEPNGFCLDGTYKVLSALPAGLYSDAMSNADGNFEVPVVLKIAFSEAVTSSGITLYFPQNELPKDVNIKWFEDENIVSEANFSPDSETFFCQNNVENYNGLELVFGGVTNGGHILKLCGIDYGQTLQFDSAKISKANVFQDVDILGDEIAVNTIDFEIEDKDKLFSIVSQSSVFFAVQEAQKIMVYTTIADKEEKVGVFYLKSLKGGGITAKFTAQDIMGVLDGEESIAEGYFDTTFESFCSVILAGYKYEIEESLKTEKVKGFLTECSRREALQQACFAVGAVCSTQGDEYIKFKKAATVPSMLITSSQMFAGGQTETIKPHRFLIVTAHDYAENGIDTPSVHTTELTAKAKGKVEIKDASFVNADNIEKVTERLTDFYTRKVLYKFSMPITENVRLGDMLMTYLANSYIKGNITSLDINLSGGLVADVEVVGYVFSISNNVYTGDIYAGERGLI